MFNPIKSTEMWGGSRGVFTEITDLISIESSVASHNFENRGHRRAVLVAK